MQWLFLLMHSAPAFSQFDCMLFFFRPRLACELEYVLADSAVSLHKSYVNLHKKAGGLWQQVQFHIHDATGSSRKTHVDLCPWIWNCCQEWHRYEYVYILFFKLAGKWLNFNLTTI